MKVFYSDHFVLPLPEGHRFPTVKYSMLRERVAEDGICARNVEDTVDVHFQSIRRAADLMRRRAAEDGRGGSPNER